jgi:hypothetical protein
MKRVQTRYKLNKMTVLTKWGIAISCILIPVWFLVNHYLIDIDSSIQNPPSSHSISYKAAKQQLAHGKALWRDKKYQQSAQVFSSLRTKKLNAELQSLTGLYQYHTTAFNKNRSYLLCLITVNKNYYLSPRI